MRIRRIEISGFSSFGPGDDGGIVLDDLGQRTLLIGPNNSGKSNVIRFIALLKRHVRREENVDLISRITAPDPRWWWRSDESATIRGLIDLEVACLSEPERDAAARFMNGTSARISVTLEPRNDGKWSLIVSPMVDHDGTWQDFVRRPRTEGAQTEYLHSDGDYQRAEPDDAEAATALVGQWLDRIVMFAPVRSTQRGSADEAFEDGASLASEILKRQQDGIEAVAAHRFKTELCDAINNLLGAEQGLRLQNIEAKGILPTSEVVDVTGYQLDSPKGASTPELFLAFDDHAPLPLHALGSGIEQAIIMLSTLVQRPDGRIYLVEEPEAHLHAGLLHRLLDTMGEGNSQFLITSHSSVVMNALGTSDRVFSFSLSPQGRTMVAPCNDITSQSRLLDDLGISAGTILQANAVVWVEGPSDRIYLKTWLEQAAARRDEQLLEGVDYAILFYGGSVLAHYSLDDDAASLLRVARFSAVVMDRDHPAGASEEALRPAKQSMLAAARHDPEHRAAHLTAGWEIEYDVDGDVFSEAVAQVLGRQASSVPRLGEGTKSFTKQLAEKLEDQPELRISIASKLGHSKVRLAGIVRDLTCERDSSANTPSYVAPLLDFILSARPR